MPQRPLTRAETLPQSNHARNAHIPAVERIIGVLIQLGLATALGALFELLMRRIARRISNAGLPEVAGLVYGLLIGLVAFFGVIPMLVPLLLQIYAPALLIQHLV